jgi:hypothetical protein
MKKKYLEKGGLTIGPSHAEGGIPMVVKSTGQKVELEGGEGVINKASMSDNRTYKVEGTPRQIASAINEIDGNGVQFDKGARITAFEKGGNIYELNVSGRYSENSNIYDIYADDGNENKRVGHAKIRESYNYPNAVEIQEMKIDEHYSHPLTYTYFTKAIIDRAEKTGAIFNIECIGDECYEELVRIGDVSDNCNNLIIRK